MSPRLASRFAALLLASTLCAPAAFAADPWDLAPLGKQAGTVMVRLRAIGVLPENTSSATSIGGSVEATNQAAPELDLSYFFTDHIAAELIAASTRHSISASRTAIGGVDIGSTYILPPTLTLQYHFRPHARFSPYIGAGVTVAWFYDTKPADPPITKLGLATTAGPAFQIGADYNVGGHWFLNVDAKQLILNVRARANEGAIRARVSLDPTIIGAGIGYRF
ncbi:outer membrane beta-barrel protein [Acetobacteraceae bacterium KSS8]|uniref:Outer membrane beta-barrel protein n=1 Tax=Endosaccharibacter trunci TaxID=2812733 RepID=A0ABT1W7I0_9PROT|nr:outer membrane beta-barrel protein [Acetobacteraceae bacterium KSS8]